MRKVQARRMKSKEMAMDADGERDYKLSCELNLLELDLKKTERGSISIRPSFCFFSESHSLLPSYAGLSFEMHHGGIASASCSVFQMPAFTGSTCRPETPFLIGE